MADVDAACNLPCQHVAEDDSDVEPENVPLPRSSMVSVRLSDIPFDPDLDIIDERDVPQEVSVPHSGSPSTRSSRSSSRTSESSISMNSVNWEGLEKTEEQEAKYDATDESTALLLARLEKENAALAVDPKAGISTTSRPRKNTRPPSMHQLKRMVTGPQPQSLRYSLLPAPPMTELEFWAALVQDYTQTAQRLPTLTSNKIRGGVPPPLRGVVWPSIARAHDGFLHSEYQRLSNQPSPYDGLIGKDVGRSFPNVDMFREKDGDGQRMLGKVLKSFSLYDEKIGYCQGLGFVVGPLLMHMSEPEAFCILVRLMENYDLRSCYLPDLSGLHLRIYQFQQLLSRHLPELAAHLEELKVEPLYVSQWFLSFFAVTCPLPMLLRIYDVILSEGATETLMRVALSLMQRNQKKLLAFREFEDALQFLLSRGLWDTYAQHADDLVADFVSLTVLVSQESLQTLEASFRQSHNITTAPSLKSAAASFLGRFWAGSSHAPSRSQNLSLTIPANNVSIRTSSSGQSLTSTLNSLETTNSEASTFATEFSEDGPSKATLSTAISIQSSIVPTPSSNNRDLHQQIEELLTELSKVQRQQVELAQELQSEREEREADRQIARTLLDCLRSQTAEIKELAGEDDSGATTELENVMAQAQQQLSRGESKRLSVDESKLQLRDALSEWKEKHEAEVTKCRDLMRQLDEREVEHHTLKEQLRDARARIQDAHRDKQRLERTVSELRSRNNSVPESPADLYTPVTEFPDLTLPPPKNSGLRELRLGRPEANRSSSVGPYSKRSSSLNTQAVLATENHEPVPNDAILLELVNSKTAEAVARQELEETKAKLDALRKILGGTNSSPTTRGNSSESPIPSTPSPGTKEVPKASHAASASTGGFFSGWGKRGT
ncbi:putative GTPase activating protein (Evi5) [Cladophialophora carrionii]|uniref:Putative GTPase activating protein (Evi5) n=1 Tax=Cladophialophora carrionii TaxID=86049 RepID=A0A1C1CFF1_9EURO|nr:putative GTPase activating protein (Evi5) [Cladophialophora carrionii]